MARGGYDHVQHGYFHWSLYVIAAVQLGLTAWLWDSMAEHATATRAILSIMAVVLVVLGLAFQHLRVRDGGDRLEIRFGPLPLLRRNVAYSEIVSVEPGTSNFWDGWGIHWAPGKGWIWNIWGRRIVKLTLTDGKLRLGTNDPEGLLAHLRGKIGSRVG